MIVSINNIHCIIKFYRTRPIKDIVLEGLALKKTKKLATVDVEGKGYGVITLEDIQKGQYVAEYTYSRSYPRSDFICSIHNTITPSLL